MDRFYLRFDNGATLSALGTIKNLNGIFSISFFPVFSSSLDIDARTFFPDKSMPIRPFEVDEWPFKKRNVYFGILTWLTVKLHGALIYLRLGQSKRGTTKVT